MELTTIIPVYNAEKTLDYAIQSVLEAFKGQEIIIVDDGSYDRSGEIADAYSAINSNVRVIHVKNGGVSKARNIGITAATGEYIMFMDADDRVLLDKQLVLDDLFKNCDMLLFSFEERNMNNKFTGKFEFESRYVEKKDYVSTFLNNKYLFYGPWAKVYKRDLILKYSLKFNEGQRYGEDATFVLEYLNLAEHGIHLLDTILYSHFINPQGASYFSRFYEDMNLYLYNLFSAFKMLCANKDDNVSDYANELFCEALKHYYLRIDKKSFFIKYHETYKLFAEDLCSEKLNCQRAFKNILITPNTIDDNNTIICYYKKNKYKKIIHTIKKLLRR